MTLHEQFARFGIDYDVEMNELLAEKYGHLFHRAFRSSRRECTACWRGRFSRN